MKLAVFELERLFGDKLSYRERMSGGPPWLRWPLCATEPARLKLVSWFDRGKPEVEPKELIRRLTFIGDVELLKTAVGVIKRLPAPVQLYAVDRVNFVGVGSSLSGFCTSAHQIDTAHHPWLIVVAPSTGTIERARRVAAHEIAHSWLMKEPDRGAWYLSALEHHVFDTVTPNELEANPKAAGKIGQLKAEQARQERLAEALVDDWGFSQSKSPEEDS